MADPAELLPHAARACREEVREQRERGPQSSACHAHVVQLLVVVAQPRTRLFGPQGGKVAAKHGNGDCADGRLGIDRRLPEARRLRRSKTGGQQSRLVLAQTCGLKAALGAQTLDEGFERPHRSFRDLNLHPAQPHGRSPARWVDRRLVERDLPGRGHICLEREEPPASPDLEQRKQAFPAGESAHPLADWALGAHECAGIRLGELFGDLAPVAHARRLATRLLESLERRLSGRAVPAGSANPKRIARPVKATIVRVEIEIDLTTSPGGSDANRPRINPPLGGLGQPTRHRPEVDGIELPLDLATVHRHTHLIWTNFRTPRSNTRFAPPPSSESVRRGSPCRQTEPATRRKTSGEAAFFGGKLRPPSPVAQLAEHPAVNRRVVGSSPTWGVAPVPAMREPAFFHGQRCRESRK
jgi:hypothetical protein